MAGDHPPLATYGNYPVQFSISRRKEIVITPLRPSHAINQRQFGTC
jgi:hypothetical protein